MKHRFYCIRYRIGVTAVNYTAQIRSWQVVTNKSNQRRNLEAAAASSLGGCLRLGVLGTTDLCGVTDSHYLRVVPISVCSFHLRV